MLLLSFSYQDIIVSVNSFLFISLVVTYSTLVGALLTGIRVVDGW
jgi:hypothetical protein